MVWGVLTAHSCRSNPASLANLCARSDLVLLPFDVVTRADMLSVTHSWGTPPMNLKVSSRQPRRSSSVRVGA